MLWLKPEIFVIILVSLYITGCAGPGKQVAIDRVRFTCEVLEGIEGEDYGTRQTSGNLGIGEVKDTRASRESPGRVV